MITRRSDSEAEKKSMSILDFMLSEKKIIDTRFEQYLLSGLPREFKTKYFLERETNKQKF